MARRRRGRWMNKATDPILELLFEIDIAVSPNAIIFELNRSLDDPPGRSTVYRAFKELESRNYIVRPQGEDGTLIEITERGREYLQGERDASEDT